MSNYFAVDENHIVNLDRVISITYNHTIQDKDVFYKIKFLYGVQSEYGYGYLSITVSEEEFKDIKKKLEDRIFYEV